MINSDKRVLEHFHNLLDHTKDKEKLTVNRQNIKYLVNKLEKYFILEHANERNKEKAQERALKMKRQTKEINRLHEKINALEQSHVDVVNEYKEKERNLKKDIGKSSLDILNGNSDALYNVKRKPMNLEKLVAKVEQWSKDRGLNQSESSKQMLKTIEEVGEVAAALARNDKEALEDGIGDVLVTLIILGQQNDLSIERCLNTAYQEIADRKGKMVNGVFVKEVDLQNA